MKEPTKLQLLIDKIVNLPNWFKQARCNHDFHFEETEKGWFVTGSLAFHVHCSKCDKGEYIYMKFPPQIDK